MKLSEITEGVDVHWQWIKAHAGDEFNEMCDTLVRAEIDKISGPRAAR